MVILLGSPFIIFLHATNHNTFMKLRNLFPLLMLLFITARCGTENKPGTIMTVNGPIKTENTGIWLTHEHILVDFIGADSISPSRYDRVTVISRALPFLKKAKQMGCGTFVECTPEFLGRDPLILKALSDSAGINILTNTGYYGANNNKYIPSSYLNLSAEELSKKWIKEWEGGIGNTGIEPGFIKIAVNRDSLSEFHSTLVRAAALAHLETGLTIASHTGPAIPAFQEIEILKGEGVSPEAFIWVHASGEKDLLRLADAASMGVWISLDNLNDDNSEKLISTMKLLKEKGVLNKVLISHDAGWYDPAKENGGDFRGYNTMFEKLIPKMKEDGFTGEEIEQVFVKNPSLAYAVRIRKLYNMN